MTTAKKEFQAHIKEEIKKIRTTLSAGSLKTYASVLDNLLINCGHPHELGYFSSHAKEVVAVLASEKYDGKASRNTAVAALVVLTNLQEYKEILGKILITNNEKKEKGIMTEKEVKNNLTHDELLEKFKEVEKNAAGDLKIYKIKVGDTSPQGMARIHSLLQAYQQYIILVLCSGLFFPPRRSEDFCKMYFRGEEMKSTETNHMLKDKFEFNVYKTGSTYATQYVDIPPQVKKILASWIKMIPEGINSLLYNDVRKPLGASALTKRINTIFGRKISTTGLRHTFLTKNFGKDIEEQKAKQAKQAAVMTEMGSSINSLPYYVKQEKK